MLLPLALLFVGAVLVLNGLWMMGRISEKEIIVINFSTAAITGITAVIGMVAAVGAHDVRGAALTLLFTVTYLWVAMNRLSGEDGRGLGWFSLFVAVSVSPEAYRTLAEASSVMEVWLGLCWVAWAALWFLYFLTLALKQPIQHLAAYATLAAGIGAAWLPALVLLYAPAA